MTYEMLEEHTEEIESTHNDLATEHGRENVFVTVVGGEVVSIVGDGVGLIDPLQISVGGDNNSTE
jgi:hypothetical protein